MAAKKNDKKILDVQFNKDLLKGELLERHKKLRAELMKTEKELEARMGGLIEAEEQFKEKMHVEEMQKEIEKRPLLYTAFAFTLGIAVGAMLSRRG